MISGFSTDSFSGEHTSRFFEPFVRFFWPTISRENLEFLNHLVRKSAHVTEYMILSLLLFRALRGGEEIRWKPAWFWICIVSIAVYAALDEFHQSFVPSRGASFKDVGFDTVGGLVGLGFAWWWSQRAHKA